MVLLIAPVDTLNRGGGGQSGYRGEVVTLVETLFWRDSIQSTIVREVRRAVCVPWY